MVESDRFLHPISVLRLGGPCDTCLSECRVGFPYYHMKCVYCFDFLWESLLTFGALLVGFVIVLAWRIEPLVSGVESAGLFKNPTISVGMVCRPSGGTVDLTYPI